MLKVYFKPRPRLKKVIVELDFSTVAIKGRQSQGNLFSRYGIHKIVVKERGASTLGGQNIWYDEDVRKLNTDGRGVLVGEFEGDDRIIVFTSKHQYYITGYDLLQHFPDETVRVEKYVPDRVYSVVYFDREQHYYYLKRFTAERSEKLQTFLDEEGQAELTAMTRCAGSKLRIAYRGAQAARLADEIETDEFVGVKSHRAKGKRLTTFDVKTVTFIEPEIPSAPAEGDDGEPDQGTASESSHDAAVAEPTQGVDFEIERPAGDGDDGTFDPEQLNLF